MTLVGHLGLKGNPFEHYTAETEPHITEYAVRPPYLEAISARAVGLSSFVLFGDRGAGKSATRITVFNQVWSNSGSENEKRPLVANFTDFTSILPALKRGTLTDNDIVEAVAFVVIEQLLLWLSSLKPEERAVYLEGLNAEERTTCNVLISDFYLSRPATERQFRTQDAFNLLQSAVGERASWWISQRWDQVSAVVASIVATLSKKELGSGDEVGLAAANLLKSLRGGEAHAGRSVLVKLAHISQIFGFSGVSVFVDKVDETPQTTNSAETATKLIYPLISHIQLLEVSGFSWQFFLWSKIKGFIESDEFHVRLDKIANSVISWNQSSFQEMLDERIKFFSEGRLKFSDLFDGDASSQKAFDDICVISMGSPRELVKILDVIVREHDKRFFENPKKLSEDSVELGLDKYVTDTINTVFNEKSRGQIYRIKKVRFINREVQTAFRVGDQSARAKIKAWEDAGLVKFVGTRAAEGDLGGKPSNEYAIADARIERIMKRELVQLEELDESAQTLE